MHHEYRTRALATLAISALPFWSSPLAAQTYKYKEVLNRSGEGIPMTVSFLGERGEFFGDRIQPVIDGEPHEAQVDVLSTWPDGSVRHAVLTSMIDQVEPRQSGAITFRKVAAPPSSEYEPPTGLMQALQTRFDLVQDDGQHYTYDFTPLHAFYLLRYAWLGDSEYADGCYGSLRRDFEFRFVPHLAGNPSVEHPQIEVILRWNIYSRPSANAVVEVIVENCRTDAVKDDVSFQELVVRLGARGRELVRLEDSDLLFQTRFATETMTGGGRPRLRTRPPLRHLSQLGLVPPIDYHHPISVPDCENYISNLMENNQRGDFNPNLPLGIPLNSGPVFRYQPGTGDRADIGWVPRWTITALNSWSRWGEAVTAAGDMNGSGVFPIHNRSSETGELGLRHNDPFWADDVWFEPRIKNKHKPNIAHMPELGLVSYLLTGRKIFLEEMVSWTALATRDWWPNNGVIDDVGSRKAAWALRTLALTAALAPDNHPLKGYFNQSLRRTSELWLDQFDDSHPLGLYSNGEWKGRGRSNWPCGLRQSVWMNAWFTGMLLMTQRVHEMPELRRMIDHNWKYFRYGYTTRNTWTAPNGEVITADPDQLMQYSKCVGIYTPRLRDGKWDEVAGSLVPIDNFAAMMWYERIQCDYAFSGGDLPEFPDPGPEPIHWRPANGYEPPSASRYHEYGGGRVALFWLAQLNGLPQANDVIEVVEPWIDAKLDDSRRHAGMRCISYFE